MVHQSREYRQAGYGDSSRSYREGDKPEVIRGRAEAKESEHEHSELLPYVEGERGDLEDRYAIPKKVAKRNTRFQTEEAQGRKRG